MDPRLKPGTNRCLCSVCGEYFSSDRAFDRHRHGPADDRSCFTPPDMYQRGFRHVSRGGYWYWSAP